MVNGTGSFWSQFMRQKGRTNNQTNNRTMVLENMYIRVLTELATNRFKYTGLEGTGIDARFLELQLFWKALAVVFRDGRTDRVVALAGTPSGPVNYMDNPKRFTVYGTGFESQTLPIAECVPVWSNYLRLPDLDIVNIYANKLAEVDRTIEINLKNARITKALISDENTRLTAANINDAIERGESVIKVTRNLGNMLEAVDLGIDVHAIEKLHIVRGRLWDECMGLLGINNSNQDKKERLVEAEVSANDDQVLTVQRVNLNERQRAVDAINNMFGTNIHVDFYGDITTVDMPEIGGV